MKKRLLSLLLVTALVSMTMTGCKVGQTMQSVGQAAEQSAESVGDALIQSMGPTEASVSTGPANPVLSPEEAKQIALKHAGLTEDLVVGLLAQYEMEHGTPIYDVEFHHKAWEYDYEIHADTGEILSFSKDD